MADFWEGPEDWPIAPEGAVWVSGGTWGGPPSLLDRWRDDATVYGILAGQQAELWRSFAKRS